jgi:hypothetical protein
LPYTFCKKTLKDRKIQNHPYAILHSPKLAAASTLQCRQDTRWKRRRAFIISRSKKAPSPMRLCESMNRPAVRSKTHVDVARRPGDVSVLHWMKNYHIQPTKSENNDKSTTSGPTSLIQSIYLAPAPTPTWITMDTSDTSSNRFRQI